MASMLRFSTFLFLLGGNIFLTTGVPIFDSGESFGPRHFQESFPTTDASSRENPVPSHPLSFPDCNTTSDIVLHNSGCLFDVFYDFDPNRIPRVLTRMFCKSDELSGHLGLDTHRGQHVGCDAVTYEMPVLKMNPEASLKKRKVYRPSWEKMVLACVPAIFPIGDLLEVNVEHPT